MKGSNVAGWLKRRALEGYAVFRGSPWQEGGFAFEFTYGRYRSDGERDDVVFATGFGGTMCEHEIVEISRVLRHVLVSRMQSRYECPWEGEDA